MWLEVNENKTIIGIHSMPCDSENEWVEYDGMAEVGDRWVDGKVEERVPDEAEITRTKKERVKHHIYAHYPLWKQMNIIRKGDPEQIKKMGKFIDDCRACADNPDQLSKIKI